MSYQYTDLRPRIFSEDGVRMLMAIRDNVRKLLTAAGAVRMQEAIATVSGDSWLMLACVDYLVQIGELVEISRPGCAGQHRVFTANR